MGKVSYSPIRIVIEGANGVGKTTVAQKLRELGLDCLDGEKTTISPCMTPENAIIERANSWRNYLLNHPRDRLVILTMSDHVTLMQRIQERDGAIDKYNHEALMCDSLYNGTYNLITKHFPQSFDDVLPRLQLLDVSQMSVNEVASAICDNFLNENI